MDKLLEQMGLSGESYEKLNPVERDHLRQMLQTIEQNQLTVEGIAHAISNMKRAVEQELYKTMTLNERKTLKDVLLIARLENYSMLELLFNGSEEAKKTLKAQLDNIKKKGVGL